CKSAKCGDGVIQAGAEDCDDGNMVNTDSCVGMCKTAKCGDGFVHTDTEECDDGNMVDNDGCKNDCMLPCGNDCWGDSGCLTAGGRSIRFPCPPGNASATACDTCFGWTQITYNQWMNQGYCSDVTSKYRSVHNNETRCGQAPLCCSDPAGCA